MGINPTQPNFKSFTFDGVNSRTFGVYITGGGVFNAPERNVEMIDIAGRNGAFVLDKGNFLNIDVTYPASIACDNETDFAEAVSDLRNFLCSKVGYVRLEDDYNPNEYRLAIYKSGLDVDHDMLTGGEFDLVFECKPQRFLKSGETAISVTSGDTITNPTRFDAHPLIEAYGYGNIKIGNDTITVSDTASIGRIVVAPPRSATTPTVSTRIPNGFVNNGDAITFDGQNSNITAVWMYTGSYSVTSVSCTATGSGVTVSSETTFTTNTASITINVNTDNAFVYNYGTAKSASATGSVSIGLSDGSTKTGTINVSLSCSGASIDLSFTETVATSFFSITEYCRIGNVFAYSTKTPSYPAIIDLDTGECYTTLLGVVVSINNAVSIPAELPVLVSGNNTITYDNTFLTFYVIPRWWKV